MAISAKGVQSEIFKQAVAEISEQASEQIKRLEPEQLAAWISGAPEPQRSVLALYYLDAFNYREILSILGIKLPELSRALSLGRREFQAWLNSTVPVSAK